MRPITGSAHQRPTVSMIPSEHFGVWPHCYSKVDGFEMIFLLDSGRFGTAVQRSQHRNRDAPELFDGPNGCCEELKAARCASYHWTLLRCSRSARPL